MYTQDFLMDSTPLIGNSQTSSKLWPAIKSGDLQHELSRQMSRNETAQRTHTINWSVLARLLLPRRKCEIDGQYTRRWVILRHALAGAGRGREGTRDFYMHTEITTEILVSLEKSRLLYGSLKNRATCCNIHRTAMRWTMGANTEHCTNTTSASLTCRSRETITSKNITYVYRMMVSEALWPQ